MNLGVAILAGGASRRMGRDKAWLEADGQSLLAQAVAKVRELGAEEVLISGREAEDYSSLRGPILLPGFGPLGGIKRGLHATPSPLLLNLAVDLPHTTTAFLCKLAARCDALTGAVPKLRDELEPLAAICPRRCHVVASDARSRRAVRDIAAACLHEQAVRTVTVTKAGAVCFSNWNTPADAQPPVPCRKSRRRAAISGSYSND